MTLAVSHTEGKTQVLDAVREIKPPFSPEGVDDQFVALIKSYRRSTVVGDSASDAALLIRETHRSWRKGLYRSEPRNA